MKTAIIHDWLYTFAGAEKVLEQITDLFPQSDLFTMVDYLGAKEKFNINNSITSFIQNMPFSQKYYRQYLPLMPFAVNRFNLSKYDLILSSSHAVAKGVNTRKDQLHICYIHTPMRYAWDLRDQYLDEVGIYGLKRKFVNYVLDHLKNWDLKNSKDVNYFIANSKFIQKRVKFCYGRNATVIYPPIDIELFAMYTKKEDYYLTASRLVPYKKINLIVEAFTRLKNKKLVVIGDGPDYDKIKNLAGDNIEMLGYMDTETMIKYLQKSQAFVFAAKEDFGILPVEAQSCGTPVIAYGAGGVLETVIDGKTGLFFQEQSVDSLIEAIEKFEKIKDDFDPHIIRNNAKRFSTTRFNEEFQLFLKTKFKEFYKK